MPATGVETFEGRWRRLDHYYFLTALLASRGVQTVCCRITAATIAGLGVISAALVWSPFGPQHTVGRVLAFVVTLCCLAMAAIWLRKRWPTRLESQVSVVAGTSCIALSCLITSDPVAGLFGATAFGLVAAYAALFHSLRLLALCWTITAATLIALIVKWSVEDVAFAFASALLVALIIAFVTFTGRLTIWLLDVDTAHPNLDPLTGLLNRDGFLEQAATLIASSSRNDDRYLVVAVINLDSFSLLVGLSGAVGGDRARVEIARRLRDIVRNNAVLAHTHDSEFVIADVFTTSDASPLVDRVNGTIKAASPRLTASIGAVCTPLAPISALPAPDVLDEILIVAANAMYDARRSGGNGATFVRNPRLTVLDDPPDEEL